MHGLLNLDFVTRHTYIVLFVWVLLEQAGLPVPSLPILLAAGSMSMAGHMSVSMALLTAVVAAVIGDYGWYELGRRRGIKVLAFLCKMSIEPDSCVRQTESAFAKQGLRSLVLAKFVPGLSTAAPPLAGVFKLPMGKFLLFDSLGSLLWAGAYIALGAIFEKQLVEAEQMISQVGGSLLTAALIVLAAYIVYKLAKRQLFIRELRTARIEPQAVKRMMDRGEEMVIVDLRHPKAFEAEPFSIKGALRMTPEELSEKHEQIPRDRDVILYCT
jgi:membrane protein DedA with SNARE-associated domain